MPPTTPSALLAAADHLLALASVTPATRRGPLLLAAGRHLNAARGAHPRRTPGHPSPQARAHMTLERFALAWLSNLVGHNVARLPPWLLDLPPYPITRQQLANLPEYSTSLPTGTTPGKVWKADPFPRAGKRPGIPWLIRTYHPIPGDPRHVSIGQFRAVITD